MSLLHNFGGSVWEFEGIPGPPKYPKQWPLHPLLWDKGRSCMYSLRHAQRTPTAKTSQAFRFSSSRSVAGWRQSEPWHS